MQEACCRLPMPYDDKITMDACSLPSDRRSSRKGAKNDNRGSFYACASRCNMADGKEVEIHYQEDAEATW